MTDDIPSWLIARLINNGQLTSDRISKHARSRPCPDCHQVVLAGLDDLAFKTYVDLIPTTNDGELVAVMAGRNTFGMDRGELYLRTAIHIEHKHADTWPVYVQHVCGSSALPINLAQIPARLFARLDGSPPF